MADVLGAYTPVAGAFLALGVLYLAQALVADVAAIRAGHVPGMPVAGGHGDFLFRATRAQANTNESFTVFVALALAAVAVGANGWWTNLLVWIFVAARGGHMLTYYADLRPVRSTCFAIGFGALVGLAVIATAAIV
jgi:uncharacterized MAPEG superfamily protein